MFQIPECLLHSDYINKECNKFTHKKIQNLQSCQDNYIKCSESRVLADDYSTKKCKKCPQIITKFTKIVMPLTKMSKCQTGPISSCLMLSVSWQMENISTVNTAMLGMYVLFVMLGILMSLFNLIKSFSHKISQESQLNVWWKYLTEQTSSVIKTENY